MVGTNILGIKINPTSYKETTRQILEWANRSESRSVYAANVHMIMEAYDSIEFREMINQSDLVTPDGMPLVWMLRLKGFHSQQRVYGPTLTPHLLAAAEKEEIPVGFLGGKSNVLKALSSQMQKCFPRLDIVYAYSPPFRSLKAKEEAEIVHQIKKSGTRILLVGLGCPKQERWINAYRGKIPAVMVGVGAAFDFLSGAKPQAPIWMQRIGLEWIFRLCNEPGRLWKRYLYNNPRFIILALSDLILNKSQPKPYA